MKKLTFATALLLLSSCAARREPSAAERLHPCSASEGPADSYCGKVAVWEDRQAARGRRILLNVVLLRSIKEESAPDPLFVLAGGPGQAATDFATRFQEQFRPVQTHRDIVLVDQRGTGKSNPLDCRSGDIDDSPAASLEKFRQCLASYNGKADVTKYTTDIAMDDLDDVRRFLGYSRIDLYGVSYGSRAAMVYARRHRDHTRAVVLDGAFPVDASFPLFVPRDSQRALDLLFRDCDNDVDCHRRFPNLRARLQAVLGRLRAQPQHIHVVDPRSGLETDRWIRHSTVSGTLLAALYSPVTSSAVPLLIEEADNGTYSGFLAMHETFGPLSESVSRGMQMSVLCSEDAPRVDAPSLARQAAGTFLGADFADSRVTPCEFWPRAAIGRAYYTSTPSVTPALILSGELDPVTPPSWGDEVALQWKNSRHIVVPATGHNAAFSGCVMNLVTDFLNAGNAASLDPSCVNGLKRPPFLVGPSGPDPGAK